MTNNKLLLDWKSVLPINYKKAVCKVWPAAYSDAMINFTKLYLCEEMWYCGSWTGLVLLLLMRCRYKYCNSSERKVMVANLGGIDEDHISYYSRSIILRCDGPRLNNSKSSNHQWIYILIYHRRLNDTEPKESAPNPARNSWPECQ